MATAPPPLREAGVARRLRERDRTAWEELYAEYGPRLRAFAYRLAGNPHDADDLVQETFTRALPRLDRLDPDTVDVGAYLFTTLRNLFLKSVERGRRAEPVGEVPEPDTLAPIEDDPERSTLLRDQQEEVRVANARLAPRQRLVLALRELEDKSYAEIGAVVGSNENAVAQLISRARESLRAELRLAQLDPSRLPEECRRNLPLLSRHLDGQLRGAPLAATLSHLEGCERCQDALESMREAKRRYRALPPFLAGADELRQRIDLELTSAGYWSGSTVAWFRRGGMVVAAGIALLVAGGAGVGAAVLISGGEPVAAVAASSSSRAATTVAPTTSATTTSRATTTAPPAAATRAPRPRPTARPSAPATTHASDPAAAEEATTTKAAPPPPQPTTAVAPGSGTTTSAAPAPPPAPTIRATTRPAPDTTAPTVTILARPPGETTSGEASFSFRASEPGSTFACRLDGAPFAACGSPVAYAGLALGAHTFAVRARDRAGNTGPAATVAWTVVPPPDTTPPSTSIVSATTGGPEATFVFTASEVGSTFSCSLDGSPFEACASPRSHTGLVPGAHTFAVRATDGAGNTGEAATHTWTIAQPLPDLVISALTRSGFTVTNTGAAAAGSFVVSVTLIGTFTLPGLAAGQSATRTWSICRVGTLTAIADRGAAVLESDETNNTRSITSAC
jgi:RNA polymerase sigma factor (sigma-70 family)